MNAVVSGVKQIERTIKGMQYLAAFYERADGKWTWSVTGDGFTHKDTAESETAARTAIENYFELKEKGGAA